MYNQVQNIMKTHPTDINALFEYCHASLNLDNVDVLYFEYGNVYRPVLKNKTATMFCLQKRFLVDTRANCLTRKSITTKYKYKSVSVACPPFYELINHF